MRPSRRRCSLARRSIAFLYARSAPVAPPFAMAFELEDLFLSPSDDEQTYASLLAASPHPVDVDRRLTDPGDERHRADEVVHRPRCHVRERSAAAAAQATPRDHQNLTPRGELETFCQGLPVQPRPTGQSAKSITAMLRAGLFEWIPARSRCPDAAVCHHRGDRHRRSPTSPGPRQRRGGRAPYRPW